MLSNYVDEKKVLLDLDETTYEQALLKMLALSNVKAKEQTVRKIFEREKTMPTALGKGIFMPRVVLNEKPKSEVIIAVNSKGLAFEDYSTAKASIILLFVLSPNDDYAALLAQSLRLLTDDCLRADLLKCKRPRDVIKAIREWEEE